MAGHFAETAAEPARPFLWITARLSIQTSPLRPAEKAVALPISILAEADACFQHGRDEGMAQHVWVHPRHPDTGCRGQLLEPTGGGVTVHPSIERVAQDRSLVAALDGLLDWFGPSAAR